MLLRNRSLLRCKPKENPYRYAPREFGYQWRWTCFPVDALLVINTLIAHGSGPVNGPDTRPPRSCSTGSPSGIWRRNRDFDPALLAGGDLDPYGCDPVTITLSSQPTSGTARVNAAGHIEYTAPIGTSEEVTVSYIVTNASGVSTAGSFQVTVLANTPPLAPDLTFTTEAGVPYSISILKLISIRTP